MAVSSPFKGPLKRFPLLRNGLSGLSLLLGPQASVVHTLTLVYLYCSYHLCINAQAVLLPEYSPRWASDNALASTGSQVCVGKQSAGAHGSSQELL